MIKIFEKILLVAIFSMAILTGCSGKKNDNTPQTPQQPEQQSTQAEITDVEEKSVLTADDVKKNIESAINISDYSITEYQDGSFSYNLLRDYDAEYNLRFPVVLNSGVSMSLPASFPIMRSHGWEFIGDDIKLKTKASTNVICEKNGKQIMMYLNNLTEEETKCSNGTVSRIKFELYSKEDGYSEVLNTAPEFKFGDGVDNNTDMKGIIDVMGKPSTFLVGKDGDDCSDITLSYNNFTNKDYVKFVLSPDGKKIVSVDYSVEI